MADRPVLDPLQTPAERPRFHAAPTLNRASILQVGLDHRLGVSPWDGDEDEYPAGLYLWRSLAEAEDYAWGLGDPFDVWEIVSEVELWPDPLNLDAAYTTAPVPLADIRPVLHVPGYNDVLGDAEVPPLPDVPVSDSSWLEGAQRRLDARPADEGVHMTPGEAASIDL